MLRALCQGLLVLSLIFSVSAVGIEFPHCNCDADGPWSVESILQCQKVSDFLIATAYFSIPLELLYFVTCSNFPFKWVLFQFGAFIILCGLSHLFSVFTYERHSFMVMLALTVSKFLTALVSFATAITLLTLIPQLLRVKVRENFLRIKAHELNREVGMMKRQEEASWHVRMLTQEIRKSLDRHTILYTTLVELSKTLGLQNCAIWMPNEDEMEMNLTHELRERGCSDAFCLPIPMDDADVMEIKESNGAKILRLDSKLVSASSGGLLDIGAVAAIRMPLLHVSDFKGGTPEVIDKCYAILVLVLPTDCNRDWNDQELEIVEVVADQVAVALSHAAVLEKFQLMREKLMEQNRDLQQARTNAMMASKARNLFQKVMSQGMRRPIHSISGLLSIMQQESLGVEQRLIINSMAKTASVVSTLINDITEIPDTNTENLSLEVRPFQLHAMIIEAVSVARSLCDSKGFGFGIQVENAVPNRVVGDEKRIFQVLLHMVGNILRGRDQGCITFRVRSESDMDEKQDQRRVPWKPSSDGYANVKFEIGIKRSTNDGPSSSGPLPRRPNSGRVEVDLSFSMCKKLVQMMQGNIWAVPSSQVLAESMTLFLRFQLQPSVKISELGGSSDQHHHLPSRFLLRGLRVLLADDDDINRAVTQKMLERLGCSVSSVSSGFQCLSSLGTPGTPFDIVVLDIHMHDMDGFDVATKIQRIQKHRSGRNWPLIVALTASTQEEDVWERCLQSGMLGVIHKPVVLQGIADELHRVLKNT